MIRREQRGVPKLFNAAKAVEAVWSKLGAPDWEKVANCIRTTDTFAKAAGETVDLNRRNVAIVGVAKGSGMIQPNMATTLNYVFTDAPLAPNVCQALISRLGDVTFNCITVDSDTSTSDTLLFFATGAAGGEPIHNPDDPRSLIADETMPADKPYVVTAGSGVATLAPKLSPLLGDGAWRIASSTHVRSRFTSRFRS